MADSSFKLVTLGELIDAGVIQVATGFPFGGHNVNGDGVPHIRPFNVGTDGEIYLDQIKSIPAAAAAEKPTLRRNDIVFNNTNTKELVGKCALWSSEAQPVFSNHMTRIRVVDDSCDPAYLSFAILHHWMTGKSEMLARSHVAQASIIGSRFREIEVPWPEPAVQSNIGRLIRWVRVASRSESDQLAHTKTLKRVVMAKLFTLGLAGEAQKDTEIGPMPASWSPRTILELCEIWSGGTPRKSIPEYWTGDIPWVSGKDLKAPALDDAIDHVSAAGVEAGSRLAPAGAVLLLVRGMGLAKDLPVAVINRPMAFNQDVKALVSRGQYSGPFLRSAIYAGKERLLSQIVPSAHGTMTLNLNDVETFKVACPSDPDEAKDIVTILDTLDRKIELHQRKLAVLDELFSSLLHKLMAAEISIADLDLSVLSTASTQLEEATA
jgi:type I restriction enzyme S subunit